ncbi:uncharacterized protein LOC117108965 [Anneissia japonica]|uniref:uncharacterized protein LOC117108965 n=1 Tax=Anneissia japonica TaxID=1529436 RepID=UPI00142599E1|nr:uncharacterized protein LOC117108965 [Anneissia japonica]
MKLFLYLTIIGIFVSRTNSHRILRQTSESEVEEVESEPQEMEEQESSEAAEPSEIVEAEIEIDQESSSSSVGNRLNVTSLATGGEVAPGETVLSSSVVVDLENESEEPLGAGMANQNAMAGGDSSQEAGAAQVGANLGGVEGSELAGGDSSQEVGGTVQGGAGLGGVPISSEEVVGGATNTQPIPTQYMQSTVVNGLSTGSPLIVGTTTPKFSNRGDAFIANAGPQEGTKNQLGSGPTEDESSISPQKIGLIVGATTAGTVAVAAGVAIAYAKLKAGSTAAGAA